METLENGLSRSKKRKLSGDESTAESCEATQEYSNHIFSEETEPYSPDVGVLDDFDGGEEPEEKPVLDKLESVMQDAKFIADILSDIDVTDIYNRLKAIRANPNRIEVVTNELLEKQAVKKPAPVKTSPNSTASVMKDFVKIIDLTTTNMSALPVSAEDIEELLQAVQNRPDRVDFVFSQILGLYCLKCQGHGDLIKDVKSVLTQCPGVPFDQVSKLMLENKGDNNRVRVVLDNITPRLPDIKRTDSVTSNVSLANDLVYKDTRIIAKVMPGVDRNEIYAYLEAHHHEKNRIRIVIDELMKERSGEQSLRVGDVADHVENSPTKPSKGIFNIQDEVDELRQIFPDCDPNYLFEELEKRADDKERMKSVAMAMFDCKNYPKLKDREEQEKKISTRNRIKSLTFDLDEFFKKFPDPVKFFENEERKMNENYSKHVDIQLRNEFPQLKGKYIKKVLQKHGNHYTSSWKEIQADIADDQLRRNKKKIKARPRTTHVPLPEEPDEFFYYEQLYCQNEVLIKNHIEERETMLKLQRSEAKKKGELFECGCCFDDECMFEEMSACADGHLFCKECIRRSAEVIIGDSKTKFPCLQDDCKEEFPVSVLQSVLSTNMFSILLRRLQEEEIKQADIPDLVSCPFCSFATIMPEDDKIFKCFNPECLKESCRLCKESNHVPYHCDEVEKQGETNMRTFIETKLSEAMLRTCHRCSKRFMKDVGCNKMTCVCGASMCYVCREPDIDYGHFTGSNCTEADMRELHRKEMLEAATTAKQQYIDDHPECAEIDLKFDPIKLVEQFEGTTPGHGYDDDDDDEDNYDEDEYEDYD